MQDSAPSDPSDPWAAPPPGAVLAAAAQSRDSRPTDVPVTVVLLATGLLGAALAWGLATVLAAAQMISCDDGSCSRELGRALARAREAPLVWLPLAVATSLLLALRAPAWLVRLHGTASVVLPLLLTTVHLLPVAERFTGR